MSNETNNPAPHAGEKELKQPEDGQTPAMARPPGETEKQKQPSKRPSFAEIDDDPLTTAGTGGSEAKGRVRPGPDPG